MVVFNNCAWQLNTICSRCNMVQYEGTAFSAVVMGVGQGSDLYSQNEIVRDKTGPNFICRNKTTLRINNDS